MDDFHPLVDEKGIKEPPLVRFVLRGVGGVVLERDRGCVRREHPLTGSMRFNPKWDVMVRDSIPTLPKTTSGSILN